MAPRAHFSPIILAKIHKFDNTPFRQVCRKQTSSCIAGGVQTRCDPFVKELGHIQILPTHELSGTYLEDVRTVPEFTSKGMKTNAGGYSLFAYTCRILKTDERPSKELYRTKEAGSANSGVCARGYRDAAGRVRCTRALPCSASGEGLAAAAPETLSTVTAHVLVPNTLLQRREPGLLGEVAESRTRAGNERDEPGTSCSAGK